MKTVVLGSRRGRMLFERSPYWATRLHICLPVYLSIYLMLVRIYLSIDLSALSPPSLSLSPLSRCAARSLATAAAAHQIYRQFEQLECNIDQACYDYRLLFLFFCFWKRDMDLQFANINIFKHPPWRLQVHAPGSNCNPIYTLRSLYIDNTNNTNNSAIYTYIYIYRYH